MTFQNDPLETAVSLVESYININGDFKGVDELLNRILTQYLNPDIIKDTERYIAFWTAVQTEVEKIKKNKK